MNMYWISRALVYQKLRLKFTNMCWNIRLRQNELFFYSILGKRDLWTHIMRCRPRTHDHTAISHTHTDRKLINCTGTAVSKFMGLKKVRWCNLTALCEWWLSTHDRFNCWNHCRSMNGNPSWQSIATSKKYGLSCQT